MGGIHAECFAREQDCELVGFTNPTRSKAQAFARKFGGQVYDSAPELLEYSGCDAVVIASPQQMHCEQIVAAAKAGKHILCEKPLALTMAEFSVIEKAVKKNVKQFMVAHQMRFHPVVEWVKKNQQKIGRIYHLDLEWSLLINGHAGRCFEDYRSGGFFMELGCHVTDLSRHLMGEEVRDVTARTLRLNPKRVTEDCTHCLLQFESNAIASLLVSANHRGKRQGLLSGRVLGQKGRIEFSIYPYGRAFNGAQLILDGGRSTFVPDVMIQKMETIVPPSITRVYKGFFDAYQKQATAFLRSMRTDKTPPVTFQDGKSAIEIVLAAYHSQNLATQSPNLFSPRVNFASDAAGHPLLK